MEKLKKILKVFLKFLKIGLFTFGGGYAMLSLIENECCEKEKWVDENELMTCVALAETTPGPVAINAATYIGYKVASFWGSLAATFGVALPSFIIIFIVSLFFNNLLEIEVIANAFNGIKVAVAILIASAGIKMLKKLEKKLVPILIFSISFVLLILIDIFSWNFSSIYFILIGGGITFFIFCIQNIVNKHKNKPNTEETTNEEVKDEHLS